MFRTLFASSVLALSIASSAPALSAQDAPKYAFEPLAALESSMESADTDALLQLGGGFRAAIEQAQRHIESITENLDVTPAADRAALEEYVSIHEVAIEKNRVRLALVLDALETDERVSAEADLSAAVASWRTLEQNLRPAPPIADPSFLLSKGKAWLDSGKGWIASALPGLLGNLVLFLLLLFASKLAARIAGKLARKGLIASKLNITELLRTFVVGLVEKAVLACGLMIALSTIYGADLGPLLAGLGIAGFILGFALQDTLSNFAAGLMVLLYRPYDLGDVISAGGVTGKVSAMSLVSTTLRTGDNQNLIVPNSDIWGGVITNITANETRRVDLVIGVGYDDDLDHSAEVLLEVISAHELTLSDPEPSVKVNQLGESSVDFVVRPWCKTSDYWTVYCDLQKSIKQRLDAEGISIPYPQRDLHLVGGTPLDPGQAGTKGGGQPTSNV